jgi:divalent metal cation (Fe/Co/Zn/Cd) transporter
MNIRAAVAGASVVYGIAVICAFLFGTVRTGVIVAIVGAMVLSLVWRLTRTAMESRTDRR